MSSRNFVTAQAAQAANLFVGPERSKLDMSHDIQTAFDAGLLIPVLAHDLLPGDTFTVKLGGFCRMTTSVRPLMDGLYLDVHAWAIPYRLLFPSWKYLVGEKDDPTDPDPDLEMPELTVPAGGFAENSLEDYLGIPPGVDHEWVTAIFNRAYRLTWDSFYRDQNLQAKVGTWTTDELGPDAPVETGDLGLLPRNKRHDLFTSSLPWPQAPGGEQLLPLGVSAPVTGTIVGDGNSIYMSSANYPAVDKTMSTGTGTAMSISSAFATSSGSLRFGSQTGLEIGTALADLSSATAATVNQLREAFMLQAIAELEARSGRRLQELVRGHFGVMGLDYRLQLPEFIQGATWTINSNPVVQQSGYGETDGPHEELGSLAGVNTGSGRLNFSYSTSEHCVLLVLVSARAALSYSQGLDKKFTRRVKEDHYWPMLAHLGEAPIYNREIYADGSSEDADVWGYHEAWSQYRRMQSMRTAEMRPQHATTLAVYNLTEDFGTRPYLNDSFIRVNPPMSRVLAVSGEARQFKLDLWADIKAARPLPVRSIPGLGGRL